MAITVPSLYQALLQNRGTGGFPFNGAVYDLFALGLANGIVQWGVGQPGNLALSGMAVGVAGSGTIVAATSRIIVPPTVSVMVSALSGAGIKGVLALPLATAVTTGLAQCFTVSGQYMGVALGVGSGSDISRVTVANAPTLVGTLELTLRSTLGLGPALSMLTVGLGNGIASLLLLGTGTAQVVGATAGIAASGVTNSVVV